MQRHAILIVDDEPASLRALARTLLGDCRVLTAASPMQALALLSAEPISVLVSDQRMPEMLGTELLARAAAAQPQIIRILLTGYTDVTTLIEAINAGHVYAYITKPWEPGALRLIVRRALERFDVEADRRRLLGELQEACVQLQRAAERKSRLLALASHELRTPVHLLSSALEILRAGAAAEVSSPWLEAACHAADWLGRCVRQLHVALRWESSSPRLNLQPRRIEDIVANLTRTFAPIAAQRGLTLSTAVAADLPPLHCDADSLTQALACLLSNAVRFTADGGAIHVAALRQSDDVAIEVRDTGIGIAPDLIDFVFEPFSPAGGDVDQHGSGAFEFGARGLGLGLCIAKAIVAAHGGEISVESTPGEGSRFTARLPGSTN